MQVNNKEVIWSPEPKPSLRMEVVGVALMICSIAIALLLIYIAILYLPYLDVLPDRGTPHH